MRILLISTSFNTFTQRVFTDLMLPFSLDAMREAVDQFEPDLILCPFLKQIVPEDIWKTHLTIINVYKLGLSLMDNVRCRLSSHGGINGEAGSILSMMRSTAFVGTSFSSRH